MPEGTEFLTKAYDDPEDAVPEETERWETETAAEEQKEAWEEMGYHVTIEEVSDRLEAHQEDECLLCSPAPHPNCEMYATLQILDPSKVPLPDDHEDHLVEVPVCAGHYEAFEQYQQGKNVEEVEAV